MGSAPAGGAASPTPTAPSIKLLEECSCDDHTEAGRLTEDDRAAGCCEAGLICVGYWEPKHCKAPLQKPCAVHDDCANALDYVDRQDLWAHVYAADEIESAERGDPYNVMKREGLPVGDIKCNEGKCCIASVDWFGTAEEALNHRPLPVGPGGDLKASCCAGLNELKLATSRAHWWGEGDGGNATAEQRHKYQANRVPLCGWSLY